MSKVIINDKVGLKVSSGGTGLQIDSPASFTAGLRQKVITTGVTLTAADSGAFLIPGSFATFILPAAEAGLYFKLYAGTADSHALQVSDGSRIYGNAINTNNEQSGSAEGQKIIAATLVGFNAPYQIGDYMEIVCDGFNWFLHAVTNGPLGIVAGPA